MRIMCIQDTINVQNVDAFEAEDGQYDTKVSMAVAMKDIPDIMVVSILIHYHFLLRMI